MIAYMEDVCPSAWWKSPRGVIGDAPADRLTEALIEIADEYLHTHGQLPSSGELADLFEYAMGGRVQVTVRAHGVG